MTASRVDAVIDLVGLGSAARRKAGGFSLGMRQRLGIAAAMLGDPPVLIMDEPFNGMDPEGIIWMRGFLRTLAADGRAILVSSHLMSELQGVADHLVVIGRGRVLADASVDELIARASGDQVLLRTSAPAEAASVLQRDSAAATVIDGNTLAVSGIGAQHVVEVLGEAGVPFSEVAAQRATLEDVYLQLTGGEAEFRAGSDRGARR
jgi:ABC-2 type transport system ATP-binding protein